MKFIVVAGGQGTKIWPYSRKNKPKQFQSIIGNESLFTYNVNTLLKKYSPDDIFISTKKKYIPYVLEQAPEIPMKNYIIEPDIALDRGPGEGFAFLKLSVLHPDEPFFLVQSDVIRLSADKYLHMIASMEKLVKREKRFITGGIRPTYPIMGIDYFKVGKKLELNSDLEVLKVQEFLWRTDDYETTAELIKKRKVVTHSNHACWYPQLMIDAYEKFRPDWYEALSQMRDAFGKRDEEKIIEQVYSKMEKGSTEEVTKNIFASGYVVNLPFKWIDVGTWNSLYEYMSENGEAYLDGNILAIESPGTLIKSHNKQKLIAAMGLENMVIVDTEEILLIIPREKADKIKDIQAELKNKQMEDYL